MGYHSLARPTYRFGNLTPSARNTIPSPASARAADVSSRSPTMSLLQSLVIEEIQALAALEAGAGAMLAACRLAGLSALGADYAGVRWGAMQTGAQRSARPEQGSTGPGASRCHSRDIGTARKRRDSGVYVNGRALRDRPTASAAAPLTRRNHLPSVAFDRQARLIPAPQPGRARPRADRPWRGAFCGVVRRLAANVLGSPSAG
jgi:hypothetical protein